MAENLPSYLKPVTEGLPDYLKPVEAPEESNSFGSTLAQNRKMNPNLLKGLAAGAIQDVIGAANTPHKFMNSIPEAFPNRTGESVVGLNNPDFATRRAEDIGQILPYIAGEEGLVASRLIKGAKELPFLQKMLRNAEVGGAFGATNSENPYMGGAEGALINALLPPGIGGIIKGVRPALHGLKEAAIRKSLQYAKPALEENIAHYVKAPAAPEELVNELMEMRKGTKREGMPLSEPYRELAFEKGAKNYKGERENASTIWGNLESEAEKAKVPFDRAPYTNSLSRRIEEMRKGASGQKSLEEQMQGAKGYLEGYMNPETSRLETLSDAIKHGKALNADYRGEFKPNSTIPKTETELGAIKYAKNALRETLNKQLEKPELSDLKNLYGNANEATQNLKQTFEQVPSPKGGINKSVFSRLANSPLSSNDVTGFVKDYMPKAGEKGVMRWEQLEKVTGDPRLTKQVVMDELFGGAVVGDHLDPAKALTKYSELSDKQKDYLFPSTYRRQMDALAELDARGKGHGTKSGFWYHTVPAIMGSLIGRMMGEGWLEGGVMGYGAGKVAEHGLEKAFENPERLNAAVEKILNKEKPTVPKGVSDEVLNYLSKGLPGVTTVPLVNALGGQ